MRSLRTRILVFLVPLASVTVLAAAGWIHVSVRRDLVAALDRTLLALAMNVAEGIGLEVDGSIEFDRDEVQVAAFEDDVQAFYLVGFRDGSPLASSLPGPGPSLPPPGEAPTFTTLEHGGLAYRTVSLEVAVAPEEDEEDRQEWLEDHPGQTLPEVQPEVFRVAVGRSTGEVEDALAALNRRLLAGFGALLVSLVLLPVTVVSLALRPLRDLSLQAQSVGPGTPRARLDDTGADSEVRDLVRAFNRALERITTALEQQKRFSADAAHELRTPITAIRTQCEVALRKPRDASHLQRTLHTVLQTALRMGGMVEGLLSFSRFRERAEIATEPADLGEIALEAVSLNVSTAKAKRLALSVHAPKGTVVEGNPDLLVECVSNLVENAVRYTPPGGSIQVATTDSGRPSIAVSDTGPGIPADQLDKIFERFYRVDRSRSRAQGGNGLGLAIAREIAQLHGGEIRVESRTEGGTRFLLLLPAAQGRTGDRGSPEPAGPAGTQRSTHA